MSSLFIPAISFQPNDNSLLRTDLTELLEAIESYTDNPSQGLELYKKTTDLLDTSLESLSTSTDVSNANRKNNPLYSIYMYGLYRSKNGNGDEEDIARAGMEFQDKPIDSYGNSIILDEFSKPSGYNSAFAVETIRATNMWMAAVSALYEGVSLCKEGSASDRDAPNYVDPIDKAAAFWIGTHEDVEESEGASLYAWASRLDDQFDDEGDTTFIVNDKIIEGLKELQTQLGNCLTTSENDDKKELAYKMRSYADDVARYMIVPLVQSLLYYMAEFAGDADLSIEVEDVVDYVILYALVSLPPLRVCDSDAFDDLYDRLIPPSEDGSFLDNLSDLQDRYVCLQITCDQVGVPNFYVGDGTLPTCEDPPASIDIAGYEGTSHILLEVSL